MREYLRTQKTNPRIPNGLRMAGQIGPSCILALAYQAAKQKVSN